MDELFGLDNDTWFDTLTAQDRAAEDDSQRRMIRDDGCAEWALAKVRDTAQEIDRQIDVCQQMIDQYTGKINALRSKKADQTAFLTDRSAPCGA